MRPTLQKYLNMRNPPRGSKAQVAMPTAAMTGASFSLQPTNTAPVTQARGYTPPIIGNFVMPWRTIFFAILVFSGAALTIRAILDGEIKLWRGQGNAGQIVVERVVERVITATAMPTVSSRPSSAPVVVERVVIVTATPSPSVQRTERRQLPAPAHPQPAAWPAPQQAQPSGAYSCTGLGPCPPPKSAEPREPLVTVEYYRCSDGFSYTPGGIWDALFGPTIETQPNGTVDIIEGTGGVYGQPLRHKGCRIESYRR